MRKQSLIGGAFAVLVAGLLSALVVQVPAGGQSVPNGAITQGTVWTPGQWNTAWQAKQDYGGPINIGGATALSGASIQTWTNAGGLWRQVIWNQNTATGTEARLDLVTGTSAAFTSLTQLDGATPAFTIETAAGDTGGIVIDSSQSGGPLELKSGGAYKFTGAGGFTANGSTSISLGSVAPSGAHATPQEWLTITDASGNVRYIPVF